MVIDICKCYICKGLVWRKKSKFFYWKNHLPPRLEYLIVLKHKKPKDHYFKHYDLQLQALQFQSLQTSIILIENIYIFSIVRVLLDDVIPCIDLKNLCKEATWLDLNVNECKRIPNMGNFNMNMFGWKRYVYPKKNLHMASMYHHIFALIYVHSNFNACMLN